MIELIFDCRIAQHLGERRSQNHETTSLCAFTMLRDVAVCRSTNAQFSRNCHSRFLTLTSRTSDCSFAKRSSDSKVRDCLEIRCRRSVRHRFTS